MAAYRDQKFLESTRGRIVALIRRASRTVEELDVTDNGVRAHLAVLERDGIVRRRGSVRRGGSGGGKTAYVYEVTPQAEDLFPKAYGPVLCRLLDVLSEREEDEKSEALLRAVGGRLAEECGVPADDVRTRLEAAVEALNELGGLAELEERDGAPVIRGYSCLLAGVTLDHPEVCRMAETLIGDRGQRPRCCFEIASTGDTAQG